MQSTACHAHPVLLAEVCPESDSMCAWQLAVQLGTAAALWERQLGTSHSQSFTSIFICACAEGELRERCDVGGCPTTIDICELQGST